MKKMLFTLVTMLTIAVSANAMSYEQARREALFLTDKMAYELNLTDAQYEAAYEINLDYLMGVTSQSDVFGLYWERRNLDISYILYSWQWDLFRAATYFYRPLYWEAGYWHFGIYARYPHRDYFYFGHPHFYVTYRGGHSWRHNGGRSYYEGRHDHFRPHRTREEHTGMRNGWDRGDYRGNRGRSSTRVTERNDRSTRDIRNERETIGRDNRSNGTIGRDSRSNSTFGSPRQSTAVGRQSTDIERQTTTREIHTERGSINRNTDVSRSSVGTINSSSSRSSVGTINSSSSRSNVGTINNNSSRSSGSFSRSSGGSMRSSGGSFSAPSRGGSGASSSPRGNGGGSRSGGRR